MNRKIGVFLFTFFGFLTWLFLAIYFSTEGDWWTVVTVEQTSYDTFVGSVSLIRIVVGFFVFLIGGVLLYGLVRKRRLR
ncbi:hypothetical protein [Fredinandcohnia sp. 179-A 10B2 NHS]|uniref:hypothetical protein n=1 Tax=Fredinandcohnia sp. 179-A 10B2 NHS TaxID=3235176 RepID=UPI0039A1DF35